MRENEVPRILIISSNNTECYCYVCPNNVKSKCKLVEQASQCLLWQLFYYIYIAGNRFEMMQ